jgi:hypothetical protein
MRWPRNQHRPEYDKRRHAPDHRVGRDRCCAYGGDRLFGQNVPYPGFGTAGGFMTSVLIIIILTSVLFIIFKRKGWL